MQPILERARRIADELLFPAALETDAADLLPVTNLDLLAHEGFYGIGGPVEAGGLGLDPGTLCEGVEALAAGCLTTAVVWLPPRNPGPAVAGAPAPGLREGCV